MQEMQSTSGNKRVTSHDEPSTQGPLKISRSKWLSEEASVSAGQSERANERLIDRPRFIGYCIIYIVLALIAYNYYYDCQYRSFNIFAVLI